MAATDRTPVPNGLGSIVPLRNDLPVASVPQGFGTTTVVTNTVTVQVSQVFTYQKRGWYSVTGLHEYWRSTDPNAPPPSGHALFDITVVGREVES